MPPRLTNEQVLLRSITEAAWQRQVQGMLSLLGWEYFHAADNRPVTTGAGRKYVQAIRRGWPDLVAFHDGQGRRIALELKREVGPVTREQVDWLRRLRRHGFETGVFRPSHAELLQRILKGLPIPPTDL
jgi:hypothetical protein